MGIYNVINASPQRDGVQRFMVQGYPTGRTSCCVESKSTTNRAEAEDWALRLNAGEQVPEANCAMYADD